MSNPERTDVVALLDRLETSLTGGDRGRLLEHVFERSGGDLGRALGFLRSAMNEHRVVADVVKTVRKLDNRTRQDGFRVLHSWDHKSHRFTKDIVPVLMLDFFDRVGGVPPDERVTVSILIDYYYLHLLALAAMRVWDDDDPDALLARITGLLDTLHGEQGSGHRFVADAETLLIYALSQFHPEEQAYDRFIARVRTTQPGRRLDFARVSTAVLSGHLRWGFWLMYGRDVVRMRADNAGDYPWLLDSVATLMRRYAEIVDGGDDRASGSGDLSSRAQVVQSLLQGLAADPWAFTGASRPPALAEHAEQYDEVLTLMERHGATLADDLEGHEPRKDVYAPLALHFNFPHNALVGIVTLALLQSRPEPLTLNALFESWEGDAEGAAAQEQLARTLMAFSRSSRDRLGYQGAMLVAYDPLSGMRSHSMTVKAIRKSLG